MLREESVHTINQKEAGRYLKEFPFLKEMVPIVKLAAGMKIAEIRIKVSVADAESLYIAPDFILPPHWWSGQDPSMMCRVMPHIYAVTPSEVRRKSWDYDHQDFFSKEILGDGSGVSAMVVVMVFSWYHYHGWKVDNSNDAFSHYEYAVHIYKPPKIGFSELLKETDIMKNVRLSDIGKLTSLEIARNPEAISVLNALDNLRNFFRDSIGVELWEKTRNYKHGGMSGVFGKTTLMSFTSGGRTSVTLKRDQSEISFIADEEHVREMGVESVGSTLTAARAMVFDVVNHWDSDFLEPDQEVLPRIF
jgi:hypothetical protein